MSTKAVSPLRRRMIEDMTIRQFGTHTERDYIRQVHAFTAFLGCPPDRAEPEDLRRYQLHLASLGASYSRMNLASTALRFFFHVTLSRPGFGDRMARVPTPERLPVVLSPAEVALLLAHAPNLKYRAALSNPHDVLQSSYAAARLASDNANVLRNALGREPTAGELYLAHQQGAGGAAKLLANPDVPAATIVGAKAVQQNGGSAGMTAGQFASLWTSRFGAPGAIGPAPAQGQPGPSSGPFGALDPNAFGGGALPTMAAMGAGLGPQATALSRLLNQGPAPAGGGIAYSAAGQPSPSACRSPTSPT